jgi:hypothetical protein
MGRAKGFVLTLAIVGALAVGSAAGAPKSCSAGAPGCDTEATTTHQAGNSGGFVSSETQRGQTTARGTESTETTTCTGPSGKELRSDHPQCQ